MTDEIGSSPFAFYAFYQLYAHLHGEDGAELRFEDVQELFPEQRIESQELSEKTSLFITWKKKSGSRTTYELRGCIGTFAKLPLLKGIQQYSLIAALEDHRFSPIKKSELASLRCSCNILHNFRTIYSGGDSAGDAYDWKIGVHGIELKFRDARSNRLLSATFLPEVIPEQGWDKRETFRNLIQKAGCWENADAILDNWAQYFVEVIRYEGSKSEISYKEFARLLPKLGSAEV